MGVGVEGAALGRQMTELVTIRRVWAWANPGNLVDLLKVNRKSSQCTINWPDSAYC